jgi:tRNA threonylcarbamoyl adenosine modification protein (Sua5/YciO/YrdC/YwlC family)
VVHSVSPHRGSAVIVTCAFSNAAGLTPPRGAAIHSLRRASVIVEIDPVAPEPWLVSRAAEALRRGGVAIIPTDTVYGLACGISQTKAIKRIYELKKMDPKKPLAILVDDMTTVGRYCKGVTTPYFRMLKRVLPGPYTFIFEASPEVPKIMLRKRLTIGIRMPDHPITLAILAELDEPLLTTSVRTPDDHWVVNPLEVESTLDDRVDLVVDGGPLVLAPSTVVDLSEDVPILVREGKGAVEELELFG